MNAARFWAKVLKTPTCWLFQGNLNDLGYGRVRVKGRLRAAHRVAWELTHGPIPRGALICHVRPPCTDHACVRPDHLALRPSRRMSSAA